MCIVQRWRGVPATEQAFYRESCLRDPMFFASLPRIDRRAGYLHMVVLTERQRDGYLLLDAFFPAVHQPSYVSDDDFVTWFAGHAFIATRDARPTSTP